MPAAWPAVVQAVVALLPTLPEWSGVAVYDGLAVTDASVAQYVTVGYQAGADTSGAFTQEFSDDGYFWQETGDVAMTLVCNTGSDDLPAVRGQAFALLNALQAHLQGDRWIGGVLSVDGWVSLTVDPAPIKNSAGTAMSLLVTLHYFTRI